MSGPHFHIHRHKLGFNAVPVTRTGWLATVGYVIGVTLASLVLIYPLETGLISVWTFSGLLVLILVILTWMLIKFILDNGEDI